MVDLDDLVAQLTAELADPIRARDITIACAPLGTLWGAPAQVEQVMRNLVGNAVKYSRPTGGRVEIGRLDRDDVVECWVKDDGIGIDPAYHEKVFEIFQRLKETDAEGSGVGLAIVRKVVTRVGGRVWVESTHGEGATFHFTWPAGPRASSESPVPAVQF
jgi:signal transduction histidine kinase